MFRFVFLPAVVQKRLEMEEVLTRDEWLVEHGICPDWVHFKIFRDCFLRLPGHSLLLPDVSDESKAPLFSKSQSDAPNKTSFKLVVARLPLRRHEFQEMRNLLERLPVLSDTQLVPVRDIMVLDVRVAHHSPVIRDDGVQKLQAGVLLLWKITLLQNNQLEEVADLPCCT